MHITLDFDKWLSEKRAVEAAAAATPEGEVTMRDEHRERAEKMVRDLQDGNPDAPLLAGTGKYDTVGGRLGQRIRRGD